MHVTNTLGLLDSFTHGASHCSCGRERKGGSRDGFTLVELLAVIVLLSLITATAALAVRLPMLKAQREHSLAQLQSLDALARDRSRRGQAVRLEIDTEQKTARLLDAKNREWAAPTLLGIHGDKVRIVGVDGRGDSKTLIEFDQFGTSLSYAVQIGQNADDSKWLLFLGVTGQSYVLENRSVVDAIIAKQRRHPG